jgi:hypothetical protein
MVQCPTCAVPDMCSARHERCPTCTMPDMYDARDERCPKGTMPERCGGRCEQTSKAEADHRQQQMMIQRRRAKNDNRAVIRTDGLNGKVLFMTVTSIESPFDFPAVPKPLPVHLRSFYPSVFHFGTYLSPVLSNKNTSLVFVPSTTAVLCC